MSRFEVKNALLTLLLGLLLFSCGPRESLVVINFKENHKLEKDLHFYASTLRMMNLQKDPAFDKMVKDIQKIDFYQVSKNDFSASERKQFQSALEKDGFENYMSIRNFNLNMTLWGNDHYKTPELVTLMEQDSSYYLIDLLGMFNLAKIPELLSSFQSGNYIDIPNRQNNHKPRKQP